MKKQLSDLVKKMPSLPNSPSSSKLTHTGTDGKFTHEEHTNNTNRGISSSESLEQIHSNDIPALKEGGILTAVRIRPLNTREVGSNSRVIVSSPGYMSQGIQILNPVFFKSSTQTEKLRKLEEREFSFDYTFWSLDDASEGMSEGGSGGVAEYSSQVDIYEKIGKPIIENALSGFNSSLFAYGQTGSGKTYTMMGHSASASTTSSENMVDSDDDSVLVRGDGDDSGIIPRLCKDLLGQVKGLCSKSGAVDESSGERTIEAYMRAAYYEIYNEKLYDLLADDYEVPKKVRERAAEGAYVEGLTFRLIQTYEDIESILLAGQEKRQTAETKMNAESSRSHAIFVIQITQKLDIRTPIQIESSNGSTIKSPIGKLIGTMNSKPSFTSQIIERNSKICLIDLAGSERLNTTGATGDRLKEATNINSSLSTLGDVIRKLSDMGKSNEAGKSSVHIPYRNSVLTWILKDSLGGNSKTAMVATVSPSESSYAESLNTLRYLERAKYVETNAVINEQNSQDPYIKHLQHQLSAYKSKLNSALAKNRQQESDHKAAVDAMAEEVEMWKTRAQSPNFERSPLNKSRFSRLSFDEKSELTKQLSFDDLAVTLGSDVDLLDLVRNADDMSCEGSDNKDRWNARRRFDRSPSKVSFSESRGRTKEYFENECYDLQDSLARSMAECNNLRVRLAEVEDLHNIEIDILNEELLSLNFDNSSSHGRPEDINAITTQHKESIANLQVTVERLQNRLHEKDLELIAANTQAHDEISSCSQVIFNLETEKENCEKELRSASDSHDQLLSDYNELAIEFAKDSAEKNSEIEKLEGTVLDLRGELEVFGLVVASKDEIIAVSNAALQTKEDEAAKIENTHEGELNSVKDVINMCKQELADRDDQLRRLKTELDEKDATIERLSSAPIASGGTGSSFLDSLVAAQCDDDEINDPVESSQNMGTLSRASSDQVSEIEITQGADIHEAELLLQSEERIALLTEDYETRMLQLQLSSQHEIRLKELENADILNKITAMTESAQEEAEKQIADHNEIVKKYAEAAEAYETEINDLKGIILDSEAYLEKVVADWKVKEAHWDEGEENYEKIIHTLTDEIEVLEVDLSAKNSCLEMFESQLVAQETELNNAEAKHDEAMNAMKVDAEVMHIYLAAKEENVESLENQLKEKEIEVERLTEEKKLIEDDLTIELESFKLALSSKEESHKDLMNKLEEAVKNTGMSDEDREDINALIMESEILKQEVTVKERALMERQESLTELFEVSEALSDTLASKDELLKRMTSVEIPRLQRELVAKDKDFEDTVKHYNEDRVKLEAEIHRLQEELESIKALNAEVAGKKSRFICF